MELAMPVGSALATLEDACGESPTRVCEWLFDRTGNESLAELVDLLVHRPLRIVLIVVIAFVVGRLVRRIVRRFGDRLLADATRLRIARLRERAPGSFLNETDPRSLARAQTVVTVLSSVVGVVVWTVATLLVLGELGISLGPLLAGAGVAGIALGFGAQSIVRDFLAGLFLLIEDQFGVGDVVDVGEVSGTVERMSLRTTVLRDVNGTVWHVPNGEIRRVANKSQLWSRAVLDITVSYDTDLRFAQGVIQRVADDLWRDETFTDGRIVEPPEVWGVEQIGADSITLRLVVKTDPAEQWVVARELRLRIKEAFDAAGLVIPYAQRTVWVRDAPEPATVDPSTVAVAPVRRAQHGEDLVENPEIQ